MRSKLRAQPSRACKAGRSVDRQSDERRLGGIEAVTVDQYDKIMITDSRKPAESMSTGTGSNWSNLRLDMATIPCRLHL